MKRPGVEIAMEGGSDETERLCQYILYLEKEIERLQQILIRWVTPSQVPRDVKQYIESLKKAIED